MTITAINPAPKFLSQLEVAPASALDDHQWQLTNPLIYASKVANRNFTVPTGFITDFASVPRTIPLVYSLCGGCADEASVVHDFLYTSHLVEREVADAVFREAMEVTGVPAWRRFLMWAGVRVFGGTHW
jgi:hypothetical protein